MRALILCLSFLSCYSYSAEKIDYTSLFELEIKLTQNYNYEDNVYTYLAFYETKKLDEVEREKNDFAYRRLAKGAADRFKAKIESRELDTLYYQDFSYGAGDYDFETQGFTLQMPELTLNKRRPSSISSRGRKAKVSDRYQVKIRKPMYQKTIFLAIDEQSAEKLIIKGVNKEGFRGRVYYRIKEFGNGVLTTPTLVKYYNVNAYDKTEFTKEVEQLTERLLEYNYE